jgi:acyl carrier protein
MTEYVESDIEAAVISLLERLTHRQPGSITLSSDVVKELRIDSDDLSFIFIPELEKKFGISIPPKEWRNVHTGHETVELLKRHIQKKRPK